MKTVRTTTAILALVLITFTAVSCKNRRSRKMAEVGSIQMLDSGTISMVEAFSDKFEHWADWMFVLCSYVSMARLRVGLEAAEREEEDPELRTMTANVKENANLLYHLLVQVLQGKSRAGAGGCEEGNGFAAGRLLDKE